MEQQDLLQDLEREIYLERVTAGVRFANYIIDIIGFRLFNFLIINLIEIIRENSYRDIFEGMTRVQILVLNYFIVYTVYLIYYTLSEGLTKGRTLGKLITRTRVVRNDGSSFTFKDAFLRSLSRIVPFEPLSAFTGNPWHDSWTNTKVVKIKR